jgi:tetratricopeptide (TPR) repeat protein
MAILLNSFGDFYFLMGNVDESEKYCRESLEIFKKLRHAEGINNNRRLLGQISQSRGELETAEDYYQESLDAFRKLGYQKQIALTLKEFASLAEAKGEQPRAIEFLKEALQVFEKLCSPKANEVRSNLERLENTAPKEN